MHDSILPEFGGGVALATEGDNIMMCNHYIEIFNLRSSCQ